ncbi:type I glyceraldehyde-3-phosphate dehydrogenase [Sulfitobacter sp. M57]|uniref:type I glyceraldehyde-3-phosphate dehydrogenase n=1 Tax=unclassified Sulfitobacter TaxID=196795 RepID=UPI0023E0ED6C|nr:MULTISPECIES: type I glyceraldehyde-3-phosphate dehydrogenase [unclassified Sulfitobacter]MDF3415913.1 type I glyceraldehyde-3-phosphate dehydrogenase [Sulfitobacter sp. KE5]MDF3423393.1 type I glyceraldehyde-3-phosphate dehydrogenase [Sulfitobacter sp. KE43]MDF3434459.1 type I glyceraldehyde-3-phosphate dehydrogenase [Sulfitobacter sp. KE42]MDF3460099.1 type I glyceraldehyde-3-phosphate dehydrogenase [Sulfitobacter sp. S74]MDF3463997.1 type I glyceraldehyde-3-phosphate dehydrogenase [Sulfi
MVTRIAINGFGRIGRCTLRAVFESGRDDIEIVAINDLAPADHLAHLFKYDSVHGTFQREVSVKGETLVVDGREIRLTATANPADLPWTDVDVALECTGRFNSRDKAAAHLENGSKRVLVSAPASNADRTVVFGVNHDDLTPADLVVSNASCTTNCLAPMAKVLDDAFGLTTGYMTTIHAYTGDQPSHDRDHSDLYRARACALSMVPTSTGAARAISLVLPHLEGRLEGSAIRVPTANVSLVDLSFMPERGATVETVNAVIEVASKGVLKGVLGYEEAPLVSSDFNHNPLSSIFAPAQTSVTSAGMVRVVSWYDNEWGFSNRMLDTAVHIGSLI